MDKLAGTGREPDGFKVCKVNDYNTCLLLHAFINVMALDPNHLLLNYHVLFFKVCSFSRLQGGTAGESMVL